MKNHIIHIGNISNPLVTIRELSNGVVSLRNDILLGREVSVIIDFSAIRGVKVSLFSANIVLQIMQAISSAIRDKIDIIIPYDYSVNHYLSSSGFYKHIKRICRSNERLDSVQDMSSIYIKQSYITYLGDVIKDRASIADLFALKEILINHLKPSVSAILESSSQKNKDIATISLAELAVNAIQHGKSLPYIAMSRTAKYGHFSVCDNGPGFLNSLRTNYEFADTKLCDSDLKGLLLGAVAQQDKHGLSKLITDILEVDIAYPVVSNNQSYFYLSSGSSFVKLRPLNWGRLLEFSLKNDIFKNEISVESLFNNEGQPSLTNIGYTKSHISLRGSRIGFYKSIV